MTNLPTCEQRIDSELQKTESWLSDQYKKIDAAYEANEQARAEELDEEIQPYGVSISYTMTLELAGGGPSEWLAVELSRVRYGFDVSSIVYHYAWGDHAEREVTQSQAPGMWRLAEYHAEYGASLIEMDK
jgi:hypothetical protein